MRCMTTIPTDPEARVPLRALFTVDEGQPWQHRNRFEWKERGSESGQVSSDVKLEVQAGA